MISLYGDSILLYNRNNIRAVYYGVLTIGDVSKCNITVKGVKPLLNITLTL